MTRPSEPWWQTGWQWLQSNSTLLGWLMVLGVVSLVLTVLLLPLVVVRLPADYFVVRGPERRARRGFGGWAWLVFKNLLGAVFVLAGLAMLVLPGQGLLTILIGLMLLNFPGKQALERRIVLRPAIRGFLDRMRHKRGAPPLQLD
jgi:Putative transmembrane protein (PGPGW)